jgi:methyl-accepting chemotaxis protein
VANEPYRSNILYYLEGMRMFSPHHGRVEERECHQLIIQIIRDANKLMSHIDDQLKRKGTMDNVMLFGAEQVGRAGSQIAGAADRMVSAATQIHETGHRMARSGDELALSLNRAAEAFEKVTPHLQKLVEILEKAQHYAGN